MHPRLGLLFLLSVAAACGGAGPAPATATTTAAPPVQPPAGKANVYGALPAPDAAPAPEAEPATPSAPRVSKASLYDRLRDPDGAVPGLAGFAIQRKPDSDHCGGIAIVTTRSKRVAAEDAPLAAVYALEFPTGLDFSPEPEAKQKREASRAKFSQFVKQLTKAGGDATRHYQARLSSTDPAVKAMAVARIAQINLRLASLLARSEIPRDVRTGDLAAEKVKAYCETLADQAEPLQASGEDAARMCVELAKQAGAGWWNEVCVAP